MVTELRDGIWWFDLRGVNAYLVDDGGELTLVDAGMPWQGEALVDGIVDAGFAPDDLERVLVTHYDVDHVGGLARFDGLDVTVYAGHGDAQLVAGRASPDPFGRKGAFQYLAGTFVSEPRVPVAPLGDGDDAGSFTVYETPGHTPGHVAFVSESLDAAFLGDLVHESGGALELPPWILCADTGRARESVRDLSMRAPAFDVAAVGHGTPFERDGKGRLDDLAARV